ncbi:regulator of nonsense transcripts 3A isoform X3 [Cynocephalus volans]|uniref:regulator of nonsense transcripts 3A isoform X3 n=1 Tax=Cynocephalus volans TaxID=110931 RepID=UPI002FCC314C
MEAQLCRESPRREPETPPASSSGCGGSASKPREDQRTAPSKVVVRRLPPGLSKEQLEEQLHPLPAHDYFELSAADTSLCPHLYSRAYVNFTNPGDVFPFRDRFDGHVFTDSKGVEYPAVVEFAPFQKTAKKKLKKKDAKTGSIEGDPEYKKFLETYCMEEEKTSANPETLLGEIEAKTRERIARRTTPLLEYVKNRKLEKQRIREEKREERRRRELEKKRSREEEKRREEERCKRKEADKQKKTAEKEVRIKLLKKPEKGEELTTEQPKEGGEEADAGGGRREPCASCAAIRARPVDSMPQELRDRFSRRNEDELKWGKGFAQDRGKKGSQDGGVAVEAAEGPRKEQKATDGRAPGKERQGNKDPPAFEPASVTEEPPRRAEAGGAVGQRIRQGLVLRGHRHSEHHTRWWHP